MPAPATADEFLDLVRKSGLADDARIADAAPPRDSPQAAAQRLVAAGVLTEFQARGLLAGKYRGYVVGPYRVLGHLGSGGMAAVYLARHTLLDRQVALKFLPPTFAADAGYLERFYREARAAASLDHPNIVRCHDVCRERDAHFIVFEYVDGKSLDHVLRTLGPLPVPVAVSYAVQAAVGLQHAHDRGLVHRDVKPANLVLDRGGAIKVLDLGLAKVVAPPAGDKALTGEIEAGRVLGTADFLAPEQAVDSHAVDARADIYSLGATLYALLSGQVPFGGTTLAQKLVGHQMQTPKPLSTLRGGIPPGLEDVIARMMAKRPADRFPSMRAAAEALLPFAGAGPAPMHSSAPASPSLVAETGLSGVGLSGPASAIVPASSAPGGPAPAPARRRVARPLLLGALVLGAAATVAAVAAVLLAPQAPPTRPAIDPPPVAKAAPPEPKPAPNPVPGGVALAARVDLGASAERACVTPDGRLFVVGRDGLACLWSPDSGKPPTRLEGAGGWLRGCAAAPDGRLAAVGDGGLYEWPPGGAGAASHRRAGGLWVAVPAPGSADWLATGDGEAVERWRSGERTAVRLPAPLKPSHGLAALPARGRLVVAGLDSAVRLVSLPDGSPIDLWRAPTQTRSAAALGDGLALVGGGDWPGMPRDDGFVCILDTDHMEVVQRFGAPGPFSAVTVVTASADGRLVGASTGNGEVLVWERDSGRLLARWRAHEGGFAGALAFLADGRVATVGAREACVWRLPATAASPPAPPVVAPDNLAGATPARLPLLAADDNVGAGYPPGWLSRAWSAGTKAELAVADSDGRRSIAARHAGGEHSVMLWRLFDGARRGHLHEISAEYRADGPLGVRLQQEGWGARDAGRPGVTAGAWGRLTVHALAPADGAARVEFHQHAGTTAELANVTVRDLGPFPARRGRAVARFAVAPDAPDARLVGRAGQTLSSAGQLPPLCWPNVFDAATVAEFAVATVAGERAVVARVLEGPPGAELGLFGDQAAPVREGRLYRYQIEYTCDQSDASASFRDDGPDAVARRVAIGLADTRGTWRRAEGVWRATRDGHATLVVAPPPGRDVAVRRVSISEEAEPAAGP